MPIKPKTPAELQAESRARWDAIQQMEADHAEQRRIKQAEQEAQEQRILAAKRERERVVAESLARGEEPPPIQRPGWDMVFTPREQLQAEREQAEAARLAAISDRDYWFDMQPFAVRQEIKKRDGNRTNRAPCAWVTILRLC